MERRQVLELLADRSAATTADWLKRHPEIEFVSRDRTGLYADGAREGAPRARQIADRFHLLKNLRETIERPLGRFEAPSLDEEAPAPPHVRTRDPLTAAALCVKPRGPMTARQIVNVDALKAASAEFTTMRALAMRFRGLLRGATVGRLDMWLNDARASGIYGVRRFARTLRQDIEAVRNAVLEPWNNGQTEGQIERLKRLKRAMYGRAGVDLLRARTLPLYR